MLIHADFCFWNSSRQTPGKLRSRSRCTGRKPRKTIQVSAVLYEVGTAGALGEDRWFGNGEDGWFGSKILNKTHEKKHDVKKKKMWII